MKTFADFWLLYLIIAFVSIGYAVINQANRIKTGRFAEGLTGMMLSAFIGWFFGILFIAALAYQLIKG